MEIPARLADLSEAVSRGDVSDVVRLLEAQGKTVERDATNVLRVQSKDFGCAVMVGSGPWDVLQELMFALFGPWWALCTNDWYGQAQRILSERHRAAKKARA